MNSSTAGTAPVALVTGGSSGIGLATARVFASHGYRLAICGRSQQKLDAARDSIRAAGSGSAECEVWSADFNDPSQAQAVGESVLERWGQVDVLVNNAGVAPLAPVEEVTPADFESSINVNLRSLFYLTQTVWRSMKQRESGTIVNISSMAAVDPFPGFSLYGASKAWMELFTQALAAEGESANIRVCAIRPGAVETPLLRSLFPDFPPDDCVQPEDIADVVWRCIEDPSRYPSGSATPVTRQAPPA